MNSSTRTVLRKPAVLAATGWSNSTLYTKKIAEESFRSQRSLIQKVAPSFGFRTRLKISRSARLPATRRPRERWPKRESRPLATVGS